MPEFKELSDVVGVLRFQASCRCFIGSCWEGEKWRWREVNTIAFEIFCEKLLELQELVKIEKVEGKSCNLLITQPACPHVTYRAKFFLKDVKAEEGWDTDLLAAA